MTSVEYEGQLTPEDLVAGHVASLERRQPDRLRSTLDSAFWGLLAATFVLMNGWVRILPLLVIVLVYVADGLRRRQWLKDVRRLYDTHAAIRSRFHSRFDDTGFRTTGDIFEDVRAWQALREWEETPEHVIVYEAEGSGGRIIPKRIFQNESDLEQLRSILAAHLPKIDAANLSRT